MEKEQAIAERETANFEFHGTASEYFRIWVVNTLLSILTLGVYSAWAKVRTNKYFYGNTRLSGASFDYHASPIQILKGRLILVAGLAVYYTVGQYAPGYDALILIVMMLFVPYLVVRSLTFQLRNTSYRNIRFGFEGKVKDAYIVYIKAFFVTILTLGIATFWADWVRSRYSINNMRFGQSRFETSCTSGEFFGIYIRLFGLTVLLSIALALIGAFIAGYSEASAEATGDISALGVMSFVEAVLIILYLPMALFFVAYMQARKFNLLANTTLIADKHQLASRLKVGKLFWIYLSNIIVVIFSVGLMIPWAKIRVAKYRITQTQIQVKGSLDNVLASETQYISAMGEEVGDYMDVDLGF